MSRRRRAYDIKRWLQKHPQLLRRTIWGAVFVMGISIVLQLAYPAGRLLPFVAVAGQQVGGQTATAAAKELEARYKGAKISVKTQDRTFTKPIEEIGIDIKASETARAAARYGLIERFIPFSSLVIMTGRNTPMQTRVDNDRLKYFAGTISTEGFVPAKNASISVKDGKVSLVAAKPSASYGVSAVVRTLHETHVTPQTTVTLQATTKAAERTNQEVASLLDKAQKAIDTPLTLTLDGQKITPDKQVVGSWLSFPEDPKTKQLALSLDADIVKKYLAGIQSRVYKAPGKTRVQLIDNREVGRNVGASGRGIAMDKAVALLTVAVKASKKTTVTVPVVELAPELVYDRTYSNSDTGLAALLASVASSKGGFGISVMEIGGRSANANGSKRFIAASTYKLYVAYAWFKKVEAGQMSWNDSISGKSASQCFDDMIVKSDNPCAKAFAAKITWQGVEDMAKSIGAVNTDLTGANLYTTANDLAIFMYKLQNGTLVSGSDQTRLVDAMKRQIYRQGVPAGTGVGVADKVGFVDGYLNDAAIVYGPKGPYVMVIMSSGSSWTQVADAARQVHNYLIK